ncbi:MAG: diacylglycerol kinase family lipid kinase [Chloroflexi bacterium]|nr:diacylglycerol kinase family lipid kinase [Chloroflexota bacterium]MCI0577533.1 diacylglycerol kinase family lipid kinase [Chloroflexota bacterium]MCI0645628.1 diacylglycerol kinase family lipid kinase [Chloroflexota bacterium]MCI0725540.1 diacylglycerol kinase family lipid kinase [Chloroflexota bacterium]
MRAQVILNPWADRGRAGQLADQIRAWASDYGGLDLVTTEEPGHAKKLATAAVDAGYELVVAAGGDGTVHEIVNGLVQGGKAEATLGVIPIGSGNDFAYALGLLTDPETAVRRLFTGQSRPIDLARLEDEHGRYELVDNGIGIGFDATISIESRNITRVHGFAMYTLATLRTIAFYYQTPHLEIRFDEDAVEQDGLLLAVGVGPRAGGGFLITPDAHHADNLLDSCLINPVGRLTMLQMLTKVMKGTHVTSRHVTMRRNRTINIKANMPLPIHADGEIFAYPQDNVRRVTITSLPAVLPVITS